MNAIKAEDPSCRVSRSVSLYADGELEPNRAVEVETHLAVCTSCREELELIRAMRRSLRRSTARQLPKGFEERMRLVVESASVLQAPVLQAPVLQAPVLQAPVLQAPVLQAPVLQAPVLQAPVLQAPVLQSAVVEPAATGAKASTEAVQGESTHTAPLAVAAVQTSPTELSATDDSERRPSRRSAFGRRAFGRFRMSWGTAMAMAAAASFVVAFFATRTQRADSVARLPVLKSSSFINPLASADITGDADSFDQLIDRLVSLHAHPVPPETKNFDEAVDRFNGTLGVGLDRHVLRQPFGANFNGARMHVIEFREPDIEPTAELRYTMQGHRITIYVFDPRRVPIGLTHLSRRVVRSAPVYVGRVRGFSVAASENTGVGYAMASDLDADKSAQLVAEIR